MTTFADAISVLERLAVPIGVALAVLLILAVPAFRKAVLRSFQAGQQFGRNIAPKPKKPDDKK